MRNSPRVMSRPLVRVVAWVLLVASAVPGPTPRAHGEASNVQPTRTGKERLGVTAGASAPEVLVQDVLARLAELGANDVREIDGTLERIVFPMPKGLTSLATEKPPEVGPR